MSSDEKFLAIIAAALHKAGLDAVVVGNTGSILNGAPVLTEDVDLFVSDTPGNRRKIVAFARRIGGSSPRAVDDTNDVLRIYGDTPIDILFSIGSRFKFGQVRARSRRVSIGRYALQVALLEDIIDSKEAAGRDKDIACLPILRDTLRVRKQRGDD